MVKKTKERKKAVSAKEDVQRVEAMEHHPRSIDVHFTAHTVKERMEKKGRVIRKTEENAGNQLCRYKKGQ
jgi:macrodomain Ter protein organizer (MatP/YcbG family)